MPDPVAAAPIPALASKNIRLGAMLFLPLLIWVATALGLGKKLGIDFSRFTVDDLAGAFEIVKNAAIAIGTAYAGIRIILKRIRAGRDPGEPAAPIQTPAVVAAVKRLTQG